MPINTNTLYTVVVEEFGASKGSERFDTLFLNALSLTLQLLEDEAGVPTVSPHTSKQADVDLDYKYYNAVHAGVIFHLLISGEWAIKPMGDLRVLWERAKGGAQTLFLQDNPPFTRVGDTT